MSGVEQLIRDPALRELVQKRLQSLTISFNMDYKEVFRLFVEIFNQVKMDKQSKTEEDVVSWTLQRLFIRILKAKAAVHGSLQIAQQLGGNAYELLVVGFTDKRRRVIKDESGNPKTSQIYAWVWAIIKEGNSWVRGMIRLRGDAVAQVDKMYPMSFYQNVVLRKGTEGSGWWFSTKATTFDNPIDFETRAGMSIAQYWERIGFTRCTLETLPYSFTRMDPRDTRYMDWWDLKFLDVAVVGTRSGVKSNGVPWCVMTVTDATVYESAVKRVDVCKRCMNYVGDANTCSRCGGSEKKTIEVEVKEMLDVWVPPCQVVNLITDESRVLLLGLSRYDAENHRVDFEAISVIPLQRARDVGQAY